MYERFYTNKVIIKLLFGHPENVQKTEADGELLFRCVSGSSRQFNIIPRANEGNEYWPLPKQKCPTLTFISEYFNTFSQPEAVKNRNDQQISYFPMVLEVSLTNVKMTLFYTSHLKICQK